MPALRELIDPNGRIKYEQLSAFIDLCPLSSFTEQANAPFLVGRQLYEGKIRKRKDSTQSSSTLMFEPVTGFRTPTSSGLQPASQLTATQDGMTSSSGISHAIYMVRKKLYSPTEGKNVTSIGRTRENDIVIADYVISKNHAQIISFHDLFFLIDLNSTNGTFVNHHQVRPGVKVQLPLNATVAFGRLVFIFMPPIELYRALRKERP